MNYYCAECGMYLCRDPPGCYRWRVWVLLCSSGSDPSEQTALSQWASSQTPQSVPGGRQWSLQEWTWKFWCLSNLFELNQKVKYNTVEIIFCNPVCSKWAKVSFPRFIIPLASEQTARKPSSVSSLNSGLTPYVSLPKKTFLLAVSNKMKANTPSSMEAILSIPKRSYRCRRISPSTLVW